MLLNSKRRSKGRTGDQVTTGEKGRRREKDVEEQKLEEKRQEELKK